MPILKLQMKSGDVAALFDAYATKKIENLGILTMSLTDDAVLTLANRDYLAFDFSSLKDVPQLKPIIILQQRLAALSDSDESADTLVSLSFLQNSIFGFIMAYETGQFPGPLPFRVNGVQDENGCVSRYMGNSMSDLQALLGSLQRQ